MGNFSRGRSFGVFPGLLAIFSIITGCCCESIGNKVDLIIKPEQPIQTKAVGKSLLLTCGLEGGDKNLLTELKWVNPHNEQIFSGMKRGGMIMQIEDWPGKVLVLIIPQMTEGGSGTYSCMGLYGNTQKLTKTVRLETFIGITWEDAPVEQFPIIKSDYKVRCKVTANPAPAVDWLKNDELITTDDHYVIETDGLMIKKVTESDDGTYKCRAIVVDTGEIEERNIKVEVYTVPVFEPSNAVEKKEAVEGDTLDITCKASGKPPPSYMWIKSKTKQNLNVIGDRFTVNDQTGTLTITHLKKDDNGELVCEASNGAGKARKTVNLVVIVKPTIYEIKNISIPTDKEVRMECRSSGYPLPSVTFRKLSLQKPYVHGAQPNDDRIIIEQRFDEQKRETISNLIISRLAITDDGLYECIAENKGGITRRNGHLTVEYKPIFANTQMKEAWSWKQKPVNLSCIAYSIPNATIKWKLNDRDIEIDPVFKKFGNGPTSNLLVVPTDIRYYGSYKCVASNQHGTSFHSIRLQEAHEPSPILQSKREIVTATTITFSFIGPSDVGGRPIQAFIAQYKEQRRPWSEARNKTWSIDSPYILENLEPLTTYNFRFAALNEVGYGQWAADQTYVMPKRSAPEEPKILNQQISDGYVASPYADRFELRWKIPADNGEFIDSYHIKYCVAQKEEDEWKSLDDECEKIEHRTNEVSSYDLINLKPDTFYKIELRAHNSIGFSTPSEAIVKTARGEDIRIINDGTTLSSAIFIAIVVGVLLVIFIIIDVSCYFVNETGLLWMMCGKSSRKPREDDAKLGSEGKELLNSDHRDAKIHIESNTPMIDNSVKKDTTVQYDIKKAVSKTGFVGKDSAV